MYTFTGLLQTNFFLPEIRLSKFQDFYIRHYFAGKLDLPGTVSCGKIDNLSSPLEDLYTFLTGDDVKLDGQVYGN